MSYPVKIWEDLDAFRSWRATQNGTQGFVPTMGALHAGHATLVKRSLQENDTTLVSIFVNPTQFNDPADLAKYPRTWEQDLALLGALGPVHLLAPPYEALYPDHYRYRVNENEESLGLCGASRPGHFDGVLTVVLKLLMLVSAKRAYFGEKDYQQLRLIQGMARAFFLPVEIIGCPTVREEDGLALSSRNLRLTPEERSLAPKLHQALVESADLQDARSRIERAGLRVDYVEERWGRRLAAAHLGNVRLIDNVAR